MKKNHGIYYQEKIASLVGLSKVLITATFLKNYLHQAFSIILKI